MTNATDFVARYLTAWTSNDPVDIAAVFAPEAVYHPRPNASQIASGIDEITAFWLEERDEPGTWEFEWTVVVEDANAAAIRGVTSYPAGAKKGVYDNLWLVRFDTDGRAVEFTDWWISRKK
ncbi:nuclear transport factor 2 family protein [Microbacterium sp. GXS0129]|uniref:nuclear transport factor 2 family protein n=1 Tax=Microbacterium sp. GXS0129 TaxID=3377836 RepID=UPI003839CFE8